MLTLAEAVPATPLVVGIFFVVIAAVGPCLLLFWSTIVLHVESLDPRPCDKLPTYPSGESDDLFL